MCALDYLSKRVNYAVGVGRWKFWLLLILGSLCAIYAVRTVFDRELLTLPVGSRFYLTVGSLMPDHLDVAFEMVNAQTVSNQFYQNDTSPESQFYFGCRQLMGVQMPVASFQSRSLGIKVPLSTMALLFFLLAGISFRRTSSYKTISWPWIRQLAGTIAAISFPLFLGLTAADITSYFRLFGVYTRSGVHVIAVTDLLSISRPGFSDRLQGCFVEPMKRDRDDFAMVPGSRIHFTLF